MKRRYPALRAMLPSLPPNTKIINAEEPEFEVVLDLKNDGLIAIALTDGCAVVTEFDEKMSHKFPIKPGQVCTVFALCSALLSVYARHAEPQCSSPMMHCTAWSPEESRAPHSACAAAPRVASRGDAAERFRQRGRALLSVGQLCGSAPPSRKPPLPC